MADNALFISYGHGDMKPIDWLGRLTRYLAPLRRQEHVDIWDDRRITPGSDWQSEIKRALDQTTAAILLVGPAFLASDYIAAEEVPALLIASKERGARIYPLVIGYCSYKQSALAPYQSFNDPDKPLEALPEPEQNRILNEISLVVDRDLRQISAATISPQVQKTDIRHAMQEIDRYLDDTWTAFKAQSRRRNHLVTALESRLHLQNTLEYENFFFRYYGKLTEDEKFQFDQIRAITEGPLHLGNQQMLRIIEEHPQVFDEIPTLVDLRQHLVFWLNKYDRVFAKRPEMCLLYAGVEDGVPFPQHIGAEVKGWIQAHR